MGQEIEKDYASKTFHFIQVYDSLYTWIPMNFASISWQRKSFTFSFSKYDKSVCWSVVTVQYGVKKSDIIWGFFLSSTPKSSFLVKFAAVLSHVSLHVNDQQ